jgi:hypothetical protein
MVPGRLLRGMKRIFGNGGGLGVCLLRTATSFAGFHSLVSQNGQAGVHKTARISPNSRGSFSHSIPPSTDP